VNKNSPGSNNVFENSELSGFSKSVENLYISSISTKKNSRIRKIRAMGRLGEKKVPCHTLDRTSELRVVRLP
jgi:hypothetical protein